MKNFASYIRLIAAFGCLFFGAINDVDAQTRSERGVSEIIRSFRSDRLSVRSANQISRRDEALIRAQPATPHGLAFGPKLITVRKFIFLGNKVINNKQLQAAMLPYLNRPITAEGLAKAVHDAAKVYHQQHYFVARIVAPPQEIVDGTVRLLVFEGFLQDGGLELFDFARGRTSLERIRAVFDAQINPNSPIDRREYERALLIIEDMPGVHLRSRLYPGTQVGTARLRVEVHETPVVRGSLSYDNHGFYGNGLHRLTGNVQLENAFHLNERLSFIWLTSGKWQNYFAAEASTHLGTDGFSLGIVGSYLDYEMRKEYDTAGENGRGGSFGLSAGYPLLLRRDRTLRLSLRAERSIFEDLINTGPGTLTYVDALETSLHGEFSRGGSYPSVTAYALTNFSGHVDTRRGFDALGTDGFFTVLEFHVNHLQRLSPHWSANLRGKVQWASKNLNGLYKCGIGGPVTNRGYPVGEVSADQCVILNADLNYEIEPKIIGAQWQLGPFLDYAFSRQSKDTVAGFSNFSDHLASAGLAVSGHWGSSASLRAAFGYQLTESEEAKSIGTHADYSDRPFRFWLQAAFTF